MSTIYYCRTNNGFFSDGEDAHGARTLQVPDPSWESQPEDPDAQAPLIEVPNPMCSLPPAGQLIEVSPQEHTQLLLAQERGQIIQLGKNGRPVAADPPPLSEAQRSINERAWVAQRVLDTEPLVSRHRDERELEESTTLTADQYAELLAYRKELRTWPESMSFPDSAKRPVQPGWLEAMQAVQQVPTA